jgi:hypothetical protein
MVVGDQNDHFSEAVLGFLEIHYPPNVSSPPSYIPRP